MIRKARTWWTLALAGLAALALVTVTAQAEAQPQGRRGMRAGMARQGAGHARMAALRQLDLTDAQREQIRAAVEAHRASGQGRKLAELRNELRTAIFADNAPDYTRIEQLKASIAEAQAAALNARIDLDIKIAEILTPEQRQKARDLRVDPRRGRSRFRR